MKVALGYICVLKITLFLFLIFNNAAGETSAPVPKIVGMVITGITLLVIPSTLIFPSVVYSSSFSLWVIAIANAFPESCTLPPPTVKMTSAFCTSLAILSINSISGFVFIPSFKITVKFSFNLSLRFSAIFSVLLPPVKTSTLLPYCFISATKLS